MSGAFHGTKRRRRPTINITPLIDVMFLLLIFFMVSSTFREEFGIEITLPEAATGTPGDNKPARIYVQESGPILFSGDPVDKEQLSAEMVKKLETDPGARFILEADEKADFGQVVMVIDVAREIGGQELIIATEQPSGNRAPP
jgi:biopolymer transport protein ExbD